MSAKDFKFVSPGVFIEEIDNSQVPKSPVAIGPLVIGRTRRGPAFQPVRVDSFSEFVTIFGDPVGGEEKSDLWRGGIPTAPTFAAYAAQAWLKNSTPLTFIRLLGDQHPDNAGTQTAQAGWNLAYPGPNTPALAEDSMGGGAFGLFLFNSGSGMAKLGGDEKQTQGTLAAILYTTGSVLTLSGTIRGFDPTKEFDSENMGSTTGSSAMINSVGKYTYTIGAYDMADGVGTLTEESTISFSRTDSNYIRKVLNTNPTLTNAALVDTTSAKKKNFFLGQTYERAVADTITGSNSYGVILRLGRSGMDVVDGNNFKFATQAAQSGWFFSQDLRNTAGTHELAGNTLDPPFNPENLATVTRLFKFHGLTSGQEIHRNYKISVEDIKYSKNDNTPYGSFTIAIRDIKDVDNAKKYVERFTNLSLDPNSANYISKQIGDRYYEWDTNARRLIEYGSYTNRSSIVRVEVANAIDQAQGDPELLPFGVEGPIGYTDFQISGSSAGGNPLNYGTGSIVPLNGLKACVEAGLSIPLHIQTVDAATLADEVRLGVDPALGDFPLSFPFTGSVKFPTVPLRRSASAGDLSDETEAYFGAQFTRTEGGSTFDEGTYDLLYPLPVANKFSGNPDKGTKTSWYFSLDDLVMATGGTIPQVYYDSGSRATGDSISARTGSYKSVLDKGYDRFTAPMYGGFDGFDITEKEPFNATRALTHATAAPTTYSMFYSAKKAIDMFADPEFVEANILTAPGITNEGLTTHMLQTCESRGDALAIIDPRGGYIPASEDNQSEQQRITTGAGLGGVAHHVKEVADNLDARNLNTSYGAAYYPWVRISDTITGRQLWAPPSIAAFGAMSFAENKAALWFAPAGFNRGGLTEGAAGIPVTNVRSRLTSAERDYLYERNLNPIASFPNEGIVIFGQKTLQITPSALDRINVRRLMIFVKKEISRIASNLLFDQNVEQTWSRFTGQVAPFLDNIKNNFGLDDFKVVLDETTTTPDLIDRNTIYAKIFLKPTKAVEFFAIDFVITNSGAGFED
jgi:hypothetical protein